MKIAIYYLVKEKQNIDVQAFLFLIYLNKSTYLNHHKYKDTINLPIFSARVVLSIGILNVVGF